MDFYDLLHSTWIMVKLGGSRFEFQAMLDTQGVWTAVEITSSTALHSIYSSNIELESFSLFLSLCYTSGWIENVKYI